MVSEHLSQKLKFQLWLLGGRVLDRKVLAPINSFVRFFYIRAFLPFLRRQFQNQFRDGDLVARHSAKSGLRFNPFFSDLDLSVVLRETPTEEESERIVQFFQRWKKFFPFLGEIEIFTQAEIDRFQSLTGTAPLFFQIVRDIRKVRWLMGDEEAAPSVYHQYKARRSLHVLAQKYAIHLAQDRAQICLQLGDRLGDILNHLGFSGQIPEELDLKAIQCDHLNWDAEKDLGLNQKESWMLLAVLPSRAEGAREADYLARLQQSRELSFLYRAYIEAEAIQLLAVHRARPQQFPWMKGLSQELMRRLSVWGAEELQS
jgi:hypothetical protein